MGGIIGGMDINSEGEIYAGVYPFLIGYTGLYKSIDNGNSCQKIETQFEDFQVFYVFITKEDHIWVRKYYQAGYSFMKSPAMIFQKLEKCYL